MRGLAGRQRSEPMTAKKDSAPRVSADDRAVAEASLAVEAAKQRRQEALTALNAEIPFAGVAVVTLEVLTLQDTVKKAEKEYDHALRRMREATGARERRLLDGLRAREAMYAKELLDLLEPVVTKATAWQQDRAQVAQATGLATGFSP